MDHWLVIPALAAVFFLLLRLWSAHRRRRDRKRRDDQRRLELLLQPRENVKQICPQRDGRCILTSQRVIFDTRSGTHAVTLRSIHHLQGYTAQGGRTSVASRMEKLVIRAKQDYTIENTGDEFVEIAKLLTAKVKKQSDNKKESKNLKKAK